MEPARSAAINDNDQPPTIAGAGPHPDCGWIDATIAFRLNVNRRRARHSSSRAQFYQTRRRSVMKSAGLRSISPTAKAPTEAPRRSGSFRSEPRRSCLGDGPQRCFVFRGSAGSSGSFRKGRKFGKTAAESLQPANSPQELHLAPVYSHDRYNLTRFDAFCGVSRRS